MAARKATIASTLLAVVFLCTGCGGEPSASGERSVYDFRLDTVGHGRFYLNRQRGKVVMLVFWSTTCLPCKKELSALKELHRKFASERCFVGAVCTDPDNAAALEQVVSGLNPDYPMLLDPRAGLFRRFGFSALPTTVLIRPDGRVAWNRVGYDAAVHRLIVSRLERMLDDVDRP